MKKQHPSWWHMHGPPTQRHTAAEQALSPSKRAQFKLYKAQVWLQTERQPLHTLEHFDRRGFKDYHLDHIHAIFRAWQDGWPVEKAAHIDNLRFIPYQENMRKAIQRL